MNQQYQNQQPQSNYTPLQLVVLVEFGQRLSNGHCAYTGICSTDDAALPGSAPMLHRRRCRSAIALVQADDHGRPVFLFPFDKMRPCTARAFFNGLNFHLPSDYQLPLHWQVDLPELETLLLTAGQYPIEKTKLGYLIRF